MENKTGTLVSGLGGAAILALFMAPGGVPSGTSKQNASPSQVNTSTPSVAGQAAASHDNSGPWSAICKDYRTEVEHEDEHRDEETGAISHTFPPEAGTAAVEYTKHYPDPKKAHGTITEKYEVRSHPIGRPYKCLPEDQYTKIQVLLATIPDPLGSHFPMYFDRDIEALEGAAALSDYSLSRFWLPWDPTDNPNKVGASAAKLAEWKERLDQPGVLVFRKGNGERLFIFLVGETPTSGIRRGQFVNALRYMQDILSGKPRSGSLSVLAIAGPHFSASLLGMSEVLSKNVSCSTSLHIVSPVANSDPLIAPFRTALGLKEGKSAPRLKKPCNVVEIELLKLKSTDNWFLPLLLPQRRQAYAAAKYLDHLGYCPKDFAVLYEDESAAGIESTHEIQEAHAEAKASTSKQVQQNSDRDSILDAFSKSGCKDTGVFLQIAFPRDLSSLRNREDSVVPSNTEINGIKLPIWSVPVTLGETAHEAEDSPRAFAADQEASRIDHILQADVVTLRQHKIRTVLIEASNSLDTLFLLEYFLRALPNLRFATLDADQLEIGRSQNVELTGTITITGLPLLRDLTESHLDPDGTAREQHVTFESVDTEGTYMAAGLLLQKSPLANFKSYMADVCATNSIVGRSEFLFMDSQTEIPLFPCTTGSGSVLHVQPGPGRGAPRSWVLAMMAATVAIVFHIVRLFRSDNLSRKPDPRNARARFAYPSYAGDCEAKRTGLLLGLNLQYMVLVFAVWSTSYALKLEWLFDAWAIVLKWIDLGLLAICLLICFLLIYRGFNSRRWLEFVTPFIVSSVYSVSAIWVWWWLLRYFQGDFEKGREMNALRIALIPEGVSPFLPFLAVTIAYILYCSAELSNLDWAARRHARLSVPSNTQLGRLHGRIQDHLRPFSDEALLLLFWAVVIALGVGTAFRLDNSLTGFEGEFFKEWLIYAGFGICLVLIIFTVLRAWEFWRALRDLLQWLNGTLLHPAFAALHEQDLPKLRIWDLGSGDHDLVIQTRTAECLRTMCGEKARLAEQALTKMVDARITGRQHCPGTAKQLTEALNAPMPDALPYLDQVPTPWEKNAYQRYLALRFVALIRYTLLNIRNLYTFVVYGFAMLVVCVATYPFEGRSNLSALLTTVFVFILISVGLMFAQIQRNGVLSAIENSKPGELSYVELFKHLVSIGGVPALIVLATQFPSIAQLILTWAKPGLDLMK